MTIIDLVLAFLFFLTFNGIVLGAFLLLLRKINGRELEFGYEREGVPHLMREGVVEASEPESKLTEVSACETENEGSPPLQTDAAGYYLAASTAIATVCFAYSASQVRRLITPKSDTLETSNLAENAVAYCG